MSLKMCVVGIVAAVLALGGCEEKGTGGKGTSSTVPAKGEAADRCPHQIKKEKCPFCNPTLVQSEGFCGEHGVAEALCVQCRPYLKVAFREKGDWCKEHDIPDTQCIKCHPELKDKISGGHGVPPPTGGETAAGNCEHTIAKAKCPFCTPSLVESDGFCKEHDVAEALCVKCRPYMEAAFKAKGDWCAEHTTPESQCVICNPKLKEKPKG